MPKMKVCVVSGSRAEFGQLLPLLKELQADNDIILDFVATGAHLSQTAGNTVSEITENNINISKKIFIEGILDNSRKGIANQISEVIKSFAEYFNNNRPDLLIVIGDRYEMFGVAIAASTLLIPIAHICGGSTTSGAIDEVYRHSISKMSSIHFTTCDVYRNRVIQLGENPQNVYNVGSLAIENCLNMKLPSEDVVRKFVGMPTRGSYCIVTFHPVTLEKDSLEKEVYELINALDEFSGYDYIITLSNADSGGNRINEIWREEAKKRENFFVVPSLGMKRYLTALKHSEMMIGNSSSGTTEAPAMHVPTIDIGDRQKGRFFAKSLIHCDPKKNDIVEAINKANSLEFRNLLKTVNNPFGDGLTSKKIVTIIKERFNKGISVKKDFYDIKF